VRNEMKVRCDSEPATRGQREGISGDERFYHGGAAWDVSLVGGEKRCR
jgi:hypothetical protein